MSSNPKASRPSRLKNTLNHNRKSVSPLNNTGHYGQLSRSLWSKSYKNEPVPTQIHRRLMGKKYQFDESDQQDDQNLAVLQQQEQEQVEEKYKLSKFKVIRDWDQFSSVKKRRINSEPDINYPRQRCKSVAEFRLPQVLEEKKQEQQPKKKVLSKLSEVKDENQFNQIAHRISSDGSSQRSRAQSLQVPRLKLIGIPEQQVQNEIDETRSQILHLLPRHKFRISESFSKLLVDELDMRQKKRQKHHQQQQQMKVIEQQKQQQQIDTGKLADLIFKFADDTQKLNMIKDDQGETGEQGLEEAGQGVHVPDGGVIAEE